MVKKRIYYMHNTACATKVMANGASAVGALKY